jgi:hypothetical protein
MYKIAIIVHLYLLIKLSLLLLLKHQLMDILN